MSLSKTYTRINWENEPSINTPLNESNLNKMDASLSEIDDRVITLDTTKFNTTDAQKLLKSIDYDESTGKFTFTYVNGTTKVIDTSIEKIAVNFDYSSSQQKLVLTLIDGTKKYVNLSDLIQMTDFKDSDTVAFQMVAEPSSVRQFLVQADVVDGSITESKLNANFLADIKTQVALSEKHQQDASTYATNSKNSADESKSYAELAETYKNQASVIVGFNANNCEIANAVDTSIEADTDKGGIRLNKIYGDTHKSKNLLKVTLQSRTYDNGNGTVDVNADGTLHVYGNITQTWANTQSTICSMYLPQGTYTMSGCPSGGSNNDYRLIGMIYYKDGTSTTSWRDLGSGASFTISKEVDHIDFRFDILVLNEQFDLLFKPMIEEGSTASDFESYGITSVGDSYEYVDLGTLTWTKETTKNYFYTTLPNAKSVSSNSILGDVYCSDYSQTTYAYMMSTEKSVAFGTSNYLGIKDTRYSDATAFRNSVRGTLLAYKPNSKSNKNTLVVKSHGKNLLKPLFDNVTANGITAEWKDDGSLVVNGTNTHSGNTYIHLSIPYSFVDNFGEGDFVVISCNAGNSSCGMYIDGIGAIGKYKKVNTSKMTNNKSLFIKVAGSATVSNMVFKPMVTDDLNATDSDFTKYEGINVPIPLNDKLRCINDVKDYIDEDGEHHLWKEIDLGSLTWNKYTVSGDTSKWLFYATISDGVTNNGDGKPITLLSDKYESVNQSKTGSNAVAMTDKRICWNATTPQILVKDLSYSDASAFKNASVGTKLIYPLATPTVTPLSINQKSAISSLKACKEKTCIDTADTLVKATLDVDYSKFQSVALDGESYGKIVPDLVDKLNTRNTNTYSLASQLGFTSWTEVTSWDLLIDAMPNYTNYEFSFSATGRNQAYANGLLPEKQIYKLKIYKHTSRSYLELESDESNWVAYDNNDGSVPSPRSVTWRRLANTKNVSDEWSNAKSYEVGSYAIYNGTLWKCKTEHSNQAPSEGTYWTETNIASEMESANTKLNSRVYTTNCSLSNLGILIADEITAGSTSIDILKKLPTYCDLHLKATSGNRASLKSLTLIPIETNGMLHIVTNNSWASLEFSPFGTGNLGDIYKARVDLGVKTPAYDWYKFSGTIVQ